MQEGYHIYGVGVSRDDGCPLHDSCLSCPEKPTCVEDDRRLSHRNWLWLCFMANLLRKDGRDKRFPELYQKAIYRLKMYAISKSRRARRERDLTRSEGGSALYYPA